MRTRELREVISKDVPSLYRILTSFEPSVEVTIKETGIGKFLEFVNKLSRIGDILDVEYCIIDREVTVIDMQVFQASKDIEVEILGKYHSGNLRIYIVPYNQDIVNLLREVYGDIETSKIYVSFLTNIPMHPIEGMSIEDNCYRFFTKATPDALKEYSMRETKRRLNEE